MKRLCLVMFFAIAGSAGCTGEPTRPSATALAREEFILVMSELATAQPHQRATILQKHGTDEAELRAFVVANARNPGQLAEALDSVQRVIDYQRTTAR